MTEHQICMYLVWVNAFLIYWIIDNYKSEKKLREHNKWLSETLVKHWEKILKDAK